MNRALHLAVFLSVSATGCFDGHVVVPPDGGVSRFSGQWLVDAPGSTERSSYELAPDGRLLEICNSERDPDAPTIGRVVREADMMSCELVGPWSSRLDAELAIDSFCEDSVHRTVVFYVTWEAETPTEFVLAKVDGEEGWQPWIDWRWQRCPPAECDFCL